MTQFRLLAAVTLLYALGGWAAYEFVGPRLIEAIYRGQGPEALTRLLESRDTIPLETYQARARTLFLGVHVFVVWLGLCGLLHFRYRLFTRTPELRPTRATLAALGVFLVAPVALLKLIGLIAVLAASTLRRPVTCDTSRVSLGLLGLWGATFLLAPVWTTVSSGLWLAASVMALGILWAVRASGTVTFRASDVDPISLLILGGGVLLLNYRALVAPIAWRGDEGYHIAIVLTLIQNPFWLAAALVTMAAVGWGRASSRPAVIRLLVVVAITFLLVGLTYADQVAAAARYPFASRWLQALPLQLLILSPTLVRTEAFFRLVPFASAVLIGALVLSRLKPWPALAWLTAAAVVTTPLLFYYTSILYLELPAVLLALMVMMSLPDILEADARALRRSAAWLALLTLVFVKETMLPFVAAVMAVRSACQVERARTARRSARRAAIWAESEVVVLVFAPILLYLAFRTASGAPREYGFALTQILSPQPYIQFVQAWGVQAPALAALFVAGSVGLTMAGERRLVLVAWLAALATSAFIAGDAAIYAGYSRFNLPALPGMLAVAIVTLRRIVVARPRAAHALAVLWLGVNAFSLPIHGDGSRVPQWGSRAADTADYTYPYRDALAWIRDRYPDARVFATGLDYPYSYDFYFRQLKWQPPFRMHLIPPQPVSTESEIAEFFEEARRDNATVVVYHLRAGDRVPGDHVGSYDLEQVFANQARRLLVFQRLTIAPVALGPTRAPPSAATAARP